eukprot:741008-Amphidinium_carterae.1
MEVKPQNSTCRHICASYFATFRTKVEDKRSLARSLGVLLNIVTTAIDCLQQTFPGAQVASSHPAPSDLSITADWTLL